MQGACKILPRSLCHIPAYKDDNLQYTQVCQEELHMLLHILLYDCYLKILLSLDILLHSFLYILTRQTLPLYILLIVNDPNIF